MSSSKFVAFTATSHTQNAKRHLTNLPTSWHNPAMPAPEQPATTPPGSTIRALRKAKKWSQEDLAQRAEIDRATVSRVERNERYELATLKKIAIGLGVNLADLFADSRTAVWKLLPNAIREDILDYADTRIALWERKKKLPKPPQ